MAGGQERILRRRIKTVESTMKITKAMELIAASRIVKAQARVAAARPYSEQITEVIRNLAGGGAGLKHPLLQPRDDVGQVATCGDTPADAARRERARVGRHRCVVLRVRTRSRRDPRTPPPALRRSAPVRRPARRIRVRARSAPARDEVRDRQRGRTEDQ